MGEIKIPEALAKKSLWKNLFEDGYIHSNPSKHPLVSDHPQNKRERDDLNIFAPPVYRKNGIIFVPSPMEEILSHYEEIKRDPPNTEIVHYSEPGNFAIDSSANQYQQVALNLYFHMARLTQSPHTHQSMGKHFGTLTYAEVDKSSDRFYQHLGFQAISSPFTIFESKGWNQWHILGGNETTLVGVFKKRFPEMTSPLNPSLESLFEEFDGFELEYLFLTGHQLPRGEFTFFSGEK